MFRIAGWVNYLDLIISTVWIGLFVVRMLWITDYQTEWFDLNPSECGDEDLWCTERIITRTYAFFWAFQAFALSARLLVFFQTNQYLGVYLYKLDACQFRNGLCFLTSNVYCLVNSGFGTNDATNDGVYLYSNISLFPKLSIISTVVVNFRL